MPLPVLRFGRYVLIVAMFFAIGGHWLVLQTVAWGGMLVDYSRGAGVAEALARTFDGQHPCEMCKTIAKTRQNEKKHEALVVAKKLDVFHQPATPWCAPAVACWEQVLVNAAPIRRAQPPSVPPPRNA